MTPLYIMKVGRQTGETRGKGGTAMHEVTLWCVLEIKEVSDVASPTTGKRMMSPPDPDDWYIAYAMDARITGAAQLSRRHFRRALTAAMSHKEFQEAGGLQVRKNKEFSQCDRCADLNAQSTTDIDGYATGP